ncbi:MAG TPA: twin-arginine translocation signal domain-containing protein, partial [Opitutales bacterium]|nr:twin-arginine translocation signal domain-containing protein [Opitutales bacterium]
MNNLPHNRLPTTRREFLKLTGSGLGLLAFSNYAPRFLTQAAAANVPAPEKDKRILVLLQLAGGNDGLNTVIPYTDDRYHTLRPRLGIKDVSTLHKLDDHVALAPPCGAIADLASQGKFAVLQNVGYPNPNRSHFRSSEIWETASDAETFLADGWVGRYLDNCCGGTPAEDPKADPVAVHSTTTLPQTFFAQQPQNIFSVGGNSRPNQRARKRTDGAEYKPLLDEFATIAPAGETGNFLSHTLMDALVTEKRVQEVLNAYKPLATYPNSALAQSLQRVVALVAAGLETRV